MHKVNKNWIDNNNTVTTEITREIIRLDLVKIKKLAQFSHSTDYAYLNLIFNTIDRHNIR